ncbi:MAG: GNAT family N-acetyltransferase [Coriobacteriales bacterium]|jgi:hypothetical protein|nr:GNAT family N-acetyltransferase [Coriobacteriales bacterium]
MKEILSTERLILREMSMDDLPSMRKIVKDKHTMYAWGHAWSEEETVAGLEKQLHAYQEDGYGRWAVVLRENSFVIGMCGLLWQETDKDRVPEIGYLFNRASVVLPPLRPLSKAPRSAELTGCPLYEMLHKTQQKYTQKLTLKVLPS